MKKRITIVVFAVLCAAIVFSGCPLPGEVGNINTALKQQIYKDSPPGDWAAYWEAYSDLYPHGIEKLASGVTYKIIITGKADKDIPKFQAGFVRPNPNWAQRSDLSTPKNIKKGNFTYESTIKPTEAINVTGPNQISLWLLVLGEKTPGKQQSAVCAIIEDLRVYVRPQGAVSTVTMIRDVDSGASSPWTNTWRAELDLYPMVSGSFNTGTEYTVTISGSTSMAIAKFGFMLKTTSWGALTTNENSVYWNQNIPDGAFSDSYDVSLKSGMNITGAGQFYILLLNLQTDSDGLNVGDPAAIITGFNITITPK
ncbi:hypothetical protein AGMMS4952_13850 [Spirochaetia bacterium]|nr:hypothetical protein AGMMS4952_13850 [Spirochaetia bacterium]